MWGHVHDNTLAPTRSLALSLQRAAAVCLTPPLYRRSRVSATTKRHARLAACRPCVLGRPAVFQALCAGPSGGVSGRPPMVKLHGLGVPEYWL